MGDVLWEYRLQRGSSQALIGALIRAAEFTESTGKTAALHYHYDQDAKGSSGSLTVEPGPADAYESYDTLIMEVAPGDITGDPPYPPQDVIQGARNAILRLYRRLYYRRYDRRMRSDPELAEAWRARRNECNRRYRRKVSGSRRASGG